MTVLVVALGLVCVVEGLVLALAPGRLEQLVRAMSELPVDTRRLLGLAAVAAGVAMIWLSGGVPG